MKQDKQGLIDLDACVDFSQAFFGYTIRIEYWHKLENDDLEVGPLPMLGDDSLTFCHPLEATVFFAGVVCTLRGVIEHSKAYEAHITAGQF